MDRRHIGRSGLGITPIGFGAFKIGRNTGTKYDQGYALPTEEQAGRVLNGVLDLGINHIDTAPAYGLSEQRIGVALSGRRGEFVLSTKVGETYEDGRSVYDFSSDAIRQSVERSLVRLRTEVVDLLLIHSDGRDVEIMEQTDAVSTLQGLRDQGLTRAIGLSAKTPEGVRVALGWADAVMVEYHREDTSHAGVMGEAHAAGVGVLVKKGLASGRHDAREAIGFALSNAAVTSLTIGGLNLEHLRANVEAAEVVV